MEESIISTYLIPCVLAIMMIGMGMTLHLRDFHRLVEQPKAVITGLLSQVLLLPLLGFVVVKLFPLQPEYAVGVMVISLCPGGVGSNLLTLIARADTALSVTLTAISNVLLIFTLPMLINLSLRTLIGAQAHVLLPVGQTIITTSFITIIPILIGMALGHRWPDLAARSERGFRMFSGIFLVFLMLSIAFKNRDVILGSLLTLGPAIHCLNLGSMLIGFSLATLAGLNLSQRVTIAIETGFQNAALAILVTTTFLHNPQMALAPAFYGGAMFLGAFLLIGMIKLMKPVPSLAQ